MSSASVDHGVSYAGVRNGTVEGGTRRLAEECPVALVFNGSSYAVMMATPDDLEDFALGFAQTEGITGKPGDVESIEVVAHGTGFEVRMWIAAAAEARLAARRRRMVGPVGCGLCGLESIEEATRHAVTVSETRPLPATAVTQALRRLEDGQVLNHRTHAVHAAALATPEHFMLREDVGRHNALDKLAGALLRAPVPLAEAMVVISSRASVDLVQKVTRVGVSILVAVSAPTALAVRTAEAAGLTLIGVARGDGFEIYTRPDRIA